MIADIEGDKRVVIIGGGPAGLSAGYELARLGMQPMLLEKASTLGGLARTEEYRGYYFDVGGHRFLTKSKEIEQLWHEMLGRNFIKVPRLSRIYYRDRFFNYPLSIFNSLINIGPIESALILGSYINSRVRPSRGEDSFEEWVSKRFGDRLYRTFFKSYTEKVWGIPCSEIRAEWAAQRIRNLSLTAAVVNAVLGLKKTRSLTDEFSYPRRGPGMMWERFREVLEAKGSTVLLNAETVGVTHENGRVTCIRYIEEGKEVEVSVSHLISSMPVKKLVNILDPTTSDDVLEASRRLHYRAFVTVGLIVDRKDLFPDQWIYVHSPHVRVARIQNFKSWSSEMSGDPRKTNIGMEYFCNEDDYLWKLSDKDLVDLASRELPELGFCSREDIVDSFVIRQPMAYPVYDEGYAAALSVIRNALQKFANLYTIGRNGMHRYNNMDHSMLTGILAARNILGANHNLWEVNEDESYLEEEKATRWALLEKVSNGLFDKLDKLAFAVSVGFVVALLTLFATLWPVLRGGDESEAILSLFNQYLIGYTVSVKGALIASLNSFFQGFLLGWLFGYVRNFLIALFVYRSKRKVEHQVLQEFFDSY